MDNINPYSPPKELSARTSPERSPGPVVRRRFALTILASAILGSLAYTFADEVVFRTSNGAWPMLFGSAGLAVVAGFLTRDRIVAPLCCFCGTMAGAFLVGIVRGWGYAQLDICIPVAAGFSIPALVVAAIMYRKRIRSE